MFSLGDGAKFWLYTKPTDMRKNYLFGGDDDAAQRTAVVYSLLSTCKAHGVNERAWLEDVLRRIPEYEQAGKDYADLLPANWRALSAK